MIPSSETYFSNYEEALPRTLFSKTFATFLDLVNQAPRSRAIPSRTPFASAGYPGKLRKDYLKTFSFQTPLQGLAAETAENQVEQV